MALRDLLAGLLSGLLALPASCDLPRDPENTKEEATGRTLRAVLVAPALTPDEAEALAGLADRLGAELVAAPGDIHAGVAALRLGTAEVVIGGIFQSTPMTSEAAATKPIGRERFVMLLRPGENAMLLAANRVVGDLGEAGP